MNVMCQRSEDTRFHVRRLASEGACPRLQWAARVLKLIENPKYAVPFLEALKGRIRKKKADKEKYVQKSVENHLNDISKAHPE